MGCHRLKIKVFKVIKFIRGMKEVINVIKVINQSIKVINQSIKVIKVKVHLEAKV